LAGSEEGRIRDLLNEGSRLLEQRRSRDAADVFGRILLHDAEHAEARRELERASAQPHLPSPRVRRGRRLLVAAWGFAFAISGAAIAGSWDALTAQLTRTPAPSTRMAPESAHQSQPGAGEHSLAQARRQIEVGDLPGALATLDGISPEDPAYPFARRLRRDAQQASIDLGYGE